MKKITFLLSAVLFAFTLNATKYELKQDVRPIRTELVKQLPATAPVKKAPAIIAEEEWESMGLATVTTGFLTMFSMDPDTFQTEVSRSLTTEGLYKLADPYANDETETPVDWIIHAEDPDLVYVERTVTSLSTGYGNLIFVSQAGRFTASYDIATIVNALGSGTDVWGRKVKNIITISQEAMLLALSNYNSGNPTWLSNADFVIVLPDVEAPEITSVTENYAGAERVVLAIEATDDVDDVDDLTFTVTAAGETIVTGAQTTDGLLTIDGLTRETTYDFAITATDRAGRVSNTVNITVTTTSISDNEAPVLSVASITSVGIKEATLEVTATDNLTATENIVFIVTLNGEQQNFTTATGIIELTGLHSETTYTGTVVARDEANNVSDAIAIEFTTKSLEPITLDFDTYQAQYYGQYAAGYNFTIGLFTDGNVPALFLDVYSPVESKLSGSYSVAAGNMTTNYSEFYDASSTKIAVTDASATVTFLGFDTDALANYGYALGIYQITFSVTTADDNLYVGSMTGNSYMYTYQSVSGTNYVIEMRGEDIVGPEITSATAVEVAVTTATLELIATDNLTAAEDIVFTVKNGDEVLVDAQKITDNKVELTGLTPETLYSLSVFATDERGNDGETVIVTFTTLEATDLVAPELLSALIDEISDKYVTIEVEATDDETAADDITFVVIFADESEVALTADNGTITLTDLTPETEYTITVKAVDASGNRSEGRILNFTTLELQPITLDIDWVQAQRYASYDDAKGHNWSLSALEGENVYVGFDLYSAKELSLAGVYSEENNNIDLAYCGIVARDGATYDLTAATITLVFTGANSDGGNYDVTFRVEATDGNTYLGSFSGLVYAYSTNGTIELTDDEITDNIQTTIIEFNNNAPYYNVLGQRVDASYKGIVIQNGKKVLVR